MNRYFEAFTNAISWFCHKDEHVEVYEIDEFNLTKRFETLFPITAELINRSTKTGVEFRGKSLVLFTWEIGNDISGWMCQFDKPSINLIEEHQVLLDNIGGIIESFNGPGHTEIDEINYNYSLTVNQHFMYVGSLCMDKLDWIDYYLEMCKEKEIEPIDLSDSVFFTTEANGAKCFYDRKTKEVKLWSHDHNFKFVEPLPQHPNYTMHKIMGVEKFEEFVELVASQWIMNFEIKEKAAENKR